MDDVDVGDDFAGADAVVTVEVIVEVDVASVVLVPVLPRVGARVGGGRRPTKRRQEEAGKPSVPQLLAIESQQHQGQLLHFGKRAIQVN